MSVGTLHQLRAGALADCQRHQLAGVDVLADRAGG